MDDTEERMDDALNSDDEIDSEYRDDDHIGGSDVDLTQSKITCSFCGGIIKYYLEFRQLDEETFLSDIPPFHKEVEDNRRDLEKRADSCRMCAVVWSAVNDPHPSQYRDPSAPTDPRECEVWWEVFGPKSETDRPLLCIVDSVNGTVFFKFRQTPGYFLHDFASKAVASTKQSEYLSYPVLKRWHQLCLGHGGTLQDLFLINDMQSATIRLIDVEHHCLSDIPTSESYLALSYVWGSTSKDDDKLTTKNIRRLYTRDAFRNMSLARTVRDAVDVTKELGFRYLFVDRLCILQDSKDDKTIYVAAMHEIYNKAQITLVAAAGPNADAGLPGTQGTPRTKARLFHPRQSIKFDVERDFVRVYEEEFPPEDFVQRHLEESVWAQRGWTYQEEKLSERMLVFTEEAVFWKCSHISLYEDCPHDQNEHLSRGLVDMRATDAFGRDALWWGRRKKTGFSINGRPADFASITGHDNVEYTQAGYSKKRDIWISAMFRGRVQEFFQRTLTYQDDIARAFDGMIGGFKIVYEPLPVHHGMLTRSLPSELTWACEDCVENTHNTQKPHRGLRGMTQSSGLPPFPTWSWHAWLDQPSWVYGKRGYKEAMREMDEATALTTSMFAGTSDPPMTTRVYEETRPIEWRTIGSDFSPALWMTQHSLHGRALFFMALAYQLNPGPRKAVDMNSLAKLTDLGLLLPKNYDVPILQWLQRPSGDVFKRSINVLCVSYVSETSREDEVSRLVVMMLVSFRSIEGNDVAFREGLFTCDVSRFKVAQRFFKPKIIFLC